MTEVFALLMGDRQYRCWMGPVDLETIQVSSVYQRTINLKRVKELAEKFSAPAVDITIAHLPDGTERLVGGQHCALAAQRRGFRTWPFARYVECANEDEVAQLRRDLLNTRRAGAADQTEIELQARNPEYQAHLLVLARAGRGYSRRKRRDDWHHFQTLKATMQLEERVGADALVHLLTFANDCFKGQPEVCIGDVVRGVYFLFRDWATTHHNFPEERIREVLKDQNLRAFVRGISIAPFRHSSSPDGRGMTLAQIFAEFFNTNSRGLKLHHISRRERTRVA